MATFPSSGTAKIAAYFRDRLSCQDDAGGGVDVTQLRTLFRALDRAGSGRVAAPDLEVALAAWGLELTPEECRGVVHAHRPQAADGRGPVEIGYEDFIAW